MDFGLAQSLRLKVRFVGRFKVSRSARESMSQSTILNVVDDEASSSSFRHFVVENRIHAASRRILDTLRSGSDLSLRSFSPLSRGFCRNFDQIYLSLGRDIIASETFFIRALLGYPI